MHGMDPKSSIPVCGDTFPQQIIEVVVSISTYIMTLTDLCTLTFGSEQEISQELQYYNSIKKFDPNAKLRSSYIASRVCAIFKSIFICFLGFIILRDYSNTNIV